jgi:hypothetical protein
LHSLVQALRAPFAKPEKSLAGDPSEVTALGKRHWITSFRCVDGNISIGTESARVKRPGPCAVRSRHGSWLNSAPLAHGFKISDIELHGEMPYMMGEENRHAVCPQEARIIEETCIPAAGIQDSTS